MFSNRPPAKPRWGHGLGRRRRPAARGPQTPEPLLFHSEISVSTRQKGQLLFNGKKKCYLKTLERISELYQEAKIKITRCDTSSQETDAARP